VARARPRRAAKARPRRAAGHGRGTAWRGQGMAEARGQDAVEARRPGRGQGAAKAPPRASRDALGREEGEEGKREGGGGSTIAATVHRITPRAKEVEERWKREGEEVAARETK
jgi:hypothetical protein